MLEIGFGKISNWKTRRWMGPTCMCLCHWVSRSHWSSWVASTCLLPVGYKTSRSEAPVRTAPRPSPSKESPHRPSPCRCAAALLSLGQTPPLTSSALSLPRSSRCAKDSRSPSQDHHRNPRVSPSNPWVPVRFPSPCHLVESPHAPPIAAADCAMPLVRHEHHPLPSIPASKCRPPHNATLPSSRCRSHITISVPTPLLPPSTAVTVRACHECRTGACALATHGPPCKKARGPGPASVRC
jgi:hypothetical protein